MCAIAGIVNIKGERVEHSKVQRMIDTLAHRGPDGEGLYIEGNVGLGHRRLSIIDLSAAGNEPMFSSNGRFVLVFNGEIYNYLELKRELPGRKWNGTSDAEVLLAAYEVWGPACVQKLNGIFAFAIWDTKNRELFAARDHLGVKPFYYTITGDFIFASEVKGILAAGVAPKTNDSIIYEYLAYGVYEHSAETFFEGIKQLPAGHTLTLKNGIRSIKQFWSLADSVRDSSDWNDKQIQDEFRFLLNDSSKMQLRADVPIGMHVSGGIDSSILTQTINELQGGQKNFELFSFAYAGSAYDEVPYVKELAKALGWNVQITDLSPQDVIRLAQNAAWHQDQPYSGLPSLALQRLIESYKNTPIKVTLEGQGGDEVMAGYEYYMGPYWLDMAEKYGEETANKELMAFNTIRAFKNESSLKQFLQNSIESYRTPGASADGSRFAKPHLLSQSFRTSAHVEPRTYERPFGSALSNMQYRDILYTKLPRVLRSCDRASMAYGRELRVPLLDYRLVEFCLGLPLEQKILRGEQRHFVRQAFRESLPEHIIHTPKRAVVNPQREWLKKDLRPWVTEILTSESFRSRPYFDSQAVLEEYEAYCAADINPNSFHVWQWINMELWMRAFFD